MSYIFPEDVRKYKLHRFRLECKIFDLKYIALLKGRMQSGFRNPTKYFS